MRKILLRNILSNWTAMILSVLLGFFMMPFVIRLLGTQAYGFWVLLQSLISYMFLLDFGVRSSLNRYLAKFFAQDDVEEVNRVFNTGLVVYSLIGGGVVCLTLVLAVIFPVFFSFPIIAPPTVFWTIVFLGVSVALRFPIAVLESVLTGLLRYDLMNISEISGIFLRTVLMVVTLEKGYSVLGMSVATFIASVLNLLLSYVFVRRIYPRLLIFPLLANRNSLHLLASHSLYAYILLAASRLVTDAGAIIAGFLIGPTAVALYGIAGTLTSYATSVVSGISTIVPPMASTLEAQGDGAGLRTLCMRGTKGILFVGFPILFTFIFTGKTFLTLWVGEEMALSYGPLVLLSLGWAFNYGQSATASILMGLSRHRIAAWLSLGHAVIQLGLSIVLGYWYGLLGIAWGAFLSFALMSTIFQLHALSTLGISRRRFVAEALLPPLLAMLPFIISLLLVTSYFPPTTLLSYFFQVGVAVVSMLIFLPWVALTQQERIMMKGYLDWWLQTAGVLPPHVKTLE